MGFPHYFCSLNFSDNGAFPIAFFQDCAMIYPIIWFLKLCDVEVPKMSHYLQHARDPISSYTHFIGALLSVLGTGVLVAASISRQVGWMTGLSAAVFGLCPGGFVRHQRHLPFCPWD